MAQERSPAVDLSGLEDALDWLKARRNLLIGGLLLVVLVYALTAFIRRQSHESSVQPWRPVLAGETPPWSTSSADLGALLADDKVRGSDAEPYALYWQALRRFEEGDAPGALELLNAFKSRFPHHVLCEAKVADPRAPGERRSAVDSLVLAVGRLQEFNAKNPAPTANPPPPTTHSVTLVTERGNIVLGLYDTLSSKSYEAFVKIAPLLKDQFIAKVTPDRWVEIGQTESGVAVETKEFTEGFPPYESNALMHFAGAVSFRQPPFTKGPYFADLRVMLATEHAEDGRSTVFAQVTEGLDLLKALSKDERKPDAPQLLVKPLKITDVQIR